MQGRARHKRVLILTETTRSVGLGQSSGRSSLDKGGPDERIDDAEFEYDNALEGDCDSDSDCDNGLERVMDSDFVSRFCDWYSEGRGKYACREVGEVGD